jgi:ketosteroid isomerase-like protein
MTNAQITRRDLLVRAGAVAAVGGTGLFLPRIAAASVSHGSEQIGEIYELQAAFHRAKSHQDIDLMVSLWSDDATVTFNGNQYDGKEGVRGLFLNSGSWLHHRISLVTSFKDQIDVQGDTAFLYFECHDVALDTNDVGPQGTIVTHLSNYGTIQNVAGSWLFWQMHFGSSAPISVDTIYDS